MMPMAAMRVCVATIGLVVAACWAGCARSDTSALSEGQAVALRDEGLGPGHQLKLRAVADAQDEGNEVWLLSVAADYAREIETTIDPPLTERLITHHQTHAVRGKVHRDLADGRYEPIVAMICLEGWWQDRLWFRAVPSDFLHYALEHPHLTQKGQVEDAVRHLAKASPRRERRVFAARVLASVSREEAVAVLLTEYARPPSDEWHGRDASNVAEHLRRLGIDLPDELTHREALQEVRQYEVDKAFSGPNLIHLADLARMLFHSTLRAHVDAGRSGTLRSLNDPSQRRRLMAVCIRSAEEMLLCNSGGTLEEVENPGLFDAEPKGPFEGGLVP